MIYVCVMLTFCINWSLVSCNFKVMLSFRTRLLCRSVKWPRILVSERMSWEQYKTTAYIYKFIPQILMLLRYYFRVYNKHKFWTFFHWLRSLTKRVSQWCFPCVCTAGRSGNPISTRGTDYAHLITTGTPRFSDLPTALYVQYLTVFRLYLSI